MRTPFVAGNWKMNTTVAEASALVTEMKDELDRIDGVDKVLCPPFVSLAAVKGLLEGSTVKLGAQNMYFEEKGAFTGEVSPAMVAELCQFVILGHSERRHLFGETDDDVNRKVRAALQFGLTPIICVGETLEEREARRTQEVVTRQITGGLQGVDSSHGFVVAYEPIWAIGTGKAANGPDANLTVAVIRNTLSQLMGEQAAMGIRILYGGSVTADNVAEFVMQAEIDGALVGGASLKADQFVAIVQQSAAIGR